MPNAENKSMPTIPADVTLSNMQAYSKELVDYKNWNGVSGAELTMLMSEEMGEVAKEVRKLHFEQGDQAHHQQELGHELVDVLAYICRLANMYDVNLEQAYKEKNMVILNRDNAQAGTITRNNKKG